MSLNTYTLSSLGYLKILLHAAKHPSSVINGVLLGSISGSQVLIEDAVPLCHNWTNLSPSMEIGLELVIGDAAERSLLIVGFYQASESVKDVSLSATGVKVCQTLAKQFSNPIAVVLDNSKLASHSVNPLVPHFGPSWSPVPSSTNFALSASTSPADALKRVREDDKLVAAFGDFDDALENVSINWLRSPHVTA